MTGGTGSIGLLLASFAAAAVSGCGADPAHPASPTPEFRVSIPTAAPLSMSDIEALKAELANPDGQPPAQELSAAVFDDYSAIPRRDDPEWIGFIAIYRQVREIALNHGWSVQIEGFTQASVPVGTKDALSRSRARAARHALLELGYPQNRVEAIGRGVGGPTPDDRRVVIKFVRTP